MTADSDSKPGTSTSRHGDQLPAAVIITADGHHLIPQNGFPEVDIDGRPESPIVWFVHEHSLSVPAAERCLHAVGGMWFSVGGAEREAERCCDIRALLAP
jgi:hypothetical protein